MGKLWPLIFIMLSFVPTDNDSGVFCWSRSHHPIIVACKPAPLTEV